MSRETPVRKSQVGPRFAYNDKCRDFPVLLHRVEPKVIIFLEDILLYRQYISENLNELKKKFKSFYSDVIFLKSITSHQLRINQSFTKLTELVLETKKKEEEISELEKTFLESQNQGEIEINLNHHLDHLRLFDESVHEYQINLDQYQINFRELTEKIKIAEKSIKEIEELKNTASIIKELRSNKMEIVPTNSLITSDKNDEELESYCFDFFLKIEESREKLNKLKKELDNFCQQQSYQELVNLKNPDEDKIQKKTGLIIAIRDCQYKIMNNLEIIDKYELKFNELVKSIKFPEALTQSDLLMSKLNSFCLKLEGFITSNSLDNFRTQLDSLSSNAIEISTLPAPPLSTILEEPLLQLTNDSQSSTKSNLRFASHDSPEIEPINPEKLFQEILKNLLDKNQQKTNSIIVLGQEVSSNCSLFEKLKCLSAKGVDEDEQSKTSYFLINNKLVKLIYNSRDLVNSSESESGNLDHHNGDQFRKFSSEEILEKLSELENLKLKFTSSWAFDHQDSPQNPSQDLSQSFLNNFKIEIVETEELRANQSIPKSIKKEVNKLPKLTPNISASIGCFQSLNKRGERQVAL